ncbi:MAG: hypothetical protein Q9213_004660 [Squamulea squamosa]
MLECDIPMTKESTQVNHVLSQPLAGIGDVGFVDLDGELLDSMQGKTLELTVRSKGLRAASFTIMAEFEDCLLVQKVALVPARRIIGIASNNWDVGEKEAYDNDADLGGRSKNRKWPAKCVMRSEEI